MPPTSRIQIPNRIKVTVYVLVTLALSIQNPQLKLVSASSTQSETLIVDTIFIVKLCKELHRPIKLPTIVFEDNGAVIALSREMTSRAKRCKHSLLAISWIREQVEAGLIQLQQIPNDKNCADILTKITTGMQFRSKAAGLLGSNNVNAVQESDTVRDE